MATKRTLKKAGTMQIAADEGSNFLKRSWGDEKYETVQTILKSRDIPAATTSSEPASKKPKLNKTKTMTETTKESETILKGTNIDDDAKTRNQAKIISSITAPKPPKLSKKKTMIATAKESEVILKDANIDADAKTRNQSKQIKTITTTVPKLKKRSTMNATAQEALSLLEREPLKKRGGAAATAAAAKPKSKPRKKKPSTLKIKVANKKPAQLKKAGTMIRTAKEGKAFLKRQK